MNTTHTKEQVLVIQTSLAQSLCNYKVFGPTSPILERVILDGHSFLEREDAETSPSYKQVIPYVIVTCRASGAPLYLLTQRTSKQQEKRLHDKYSIGQGGHINDLDLKVPGSPIVAGMKREIAEEFRLHNELSCELIGLLNDNSNDVGKVHMGLVYVLTVGSLDFAVAEEGKHLAQWATVDGLSKYYDRMESWSQITMDHIIRPRI